jgi:hypothetical protein
MILLDTNVISEWMRPAPDSRVIAWLDGWPVGQLFVPAIAKAEIEAGIALLPEGKRRAALNQAAEVIFAVGAGVKEAQIGRPEGGPLGSTGTELAW